MKMHSFTSVDFLLSLYLFIEVPLSALNTIENKIIGQPLVECGDEFIRFSVRTMKPFRGKVFVRGQHSNSDCIRNYNVSNSTHTAHTTEKEKSSSIKTRNVLPLVPVSGSVTSITRKTNFDTTVTSEFRNTSTKENLKTSSVSTPLYYTATTQDFNHAGNSFQNGMKGVTKVTRTSPEIISENYNGMNSNESISDNFLRIKKKNAHKRKGSASVNNSNLAPTIKNLMIRDGESSVNRTFKIRNRKRMLHRKGNESASNNATSKILISESADATKKHVKSTSIGNSSHVIPNDNHLQAENLSSNRDDFNLSFSELDNAFGNGKLINELGKLRSSSNRPMIATKEPHTSKHLNFNENHEFHSSMFTTAATSRNPQCAPCPVCQDVQSIRKQREATEATAALAVRLGTCNTEHEHRAEPRAVIVSFTVIVSFHQNLLTRLDRAFRIQCAYMEGTKIIAADLSVSMPPTTELSSKIEPPKCYYTVKSLSGQAILRARVGELVEHQWTCQSTLKGVHAMLIRNCYAESDNTPKVPVIDQNGCTLDPYILPNLQYSYDLLSVKTQAPIFKFPDRSDIGFQCDVAICLRGEQNCDSVTPPKCNNGTRKRRELSSVNVQSLVLRTPTINIVDLDDLAEEPEPEQLHASTTSKSLDLCLTVIGFTCAIASATFLITIAAIVVGTFIISSTSRRTDRLPVSDCD